MAYNIQSTDPEVRFALPQCTDDTDIPITDFGTFYDVQITEVQMEVLRILLWAAS